MAGVALNPKLSPAVSTSTTSQPSRAACFTASAAMRAGSFSYPAAATQAVYNLGMSSPSRALQHMRGTVRDLGASFPFSCPAAQATRIWHVDWSAGLELLPPP